MAEKRDKKKVATVTQQSAQEILQTRLRNSAWPVFTENLLADSELIIERARRTAYRMADMVLVQRNWLLGKRIAVEELKGKGRAEYGKEVIKRLSAQLTEKYGKGFDTSNLYKFVQFSEYFPNIFHAVCGKFGSDIFYTACEQSDSNILDTACLNSDTKILDTVSPKSEDMMFVPVSGMARLSWSHYRTLLQVTDVEAREWYENEAANETWSVRTLQRNISSQYYYRMLKTYDQKGVREEMHQLTKPLQDKLEYIKNPVIAEFLGLEQNTDYHESTLEKAILNNLQRFLMELGKGYAFVARQQHIHTEKEDYYIDLVFYNVILKCYILIDLKTQKVTYQDVGQMDMYVKMYDELKCTEGDNPTLGIILCSDTDDDIARYAMHGKEQLFASKYMLYMPTKEQLREEIERQKRFFELQQNEQQ